MDVYSSSMMQWEPTFLDLLQTPEDPLSPSIISLETAVSATAGQPTLSMPHVIPEPATEETSSSSKAASELISVSSVFYPGSHELPPHDRTLRSSDSVLFYANAKAIMKTSPFALKTIFGTTLDDERLDGVMLDVPETAPILNIILHALYGMSCAKHSPSLLELETAVRKMPKYGLNPKIHISNSSVPTLFDLLLSYAPLHPIRVYTLAAQFNIDDLAVKSSSYLLSYNLPDLTDEIVTTMGAVYLLRFMTLHMTLIDTFKKIILQPPQLHPATETCNFVEQKKLSRAWVLTASYLAWDSKPDIPIHQLNNTLLALGDQLPCDSCKEMLKLRVKEVIVQWVNVKRHI